MPLISFKSMKYKLAGSLLGIAFAGSAFADAEVLRFHHFLPQQANVPTHILEAWAESVEQAANGQLDIQFFPAMQLGGTPPQLIDQVKSGAVDIVWTLPGYTPGRFRRVEVFELPFLMKDPVATSRAYWRLMEEEIIPSEFPDVHLIGGWVHGPGVIHSRVPIETIDDFNGLKVRSPTRVTNMMFSDLGASAIGMPVPAVPESLSKGVIDAAALPWETTAALRVPEMVHYHTEFEGKALYTSTFIVAMNKDRYNALSEEAKAAIDSFSGLKFAEFAGETHHSFDNVVRQKTIDAGNTIITIAEADQAPWHEGGKITAQRWVEEMDKKGLDGKALLNRAISLIEEETE